jgi:surfactin synthase thioesterase subunit
MLRAIPVIAANVGGIPEAKLGVDYLLPVRPIEKYQERVDEQMVPVADVPEQDVGPWRHALTRLVSDGEHYQRLSEDSRKAALEYAARLSVRPFEDLLARAVQTPRSNPASVRRTAAESTERAAPLESLSPEKRRLLALRLRQKSAGGPSARPAAAPQSNPWFPNIDASAGAKLRLFCFPYAGAGTSAFRGWVERLPEGIAVCPARLPGREARLEEAPLENMGSLIEHLAQAIAPYLDKPFALFGHSVGAAIAFELARALRRQMRPLPALIAVSAARAPQFRRNYTPAPAPSDEELIGQLRQLEGMSSQLLENHELLKFALPALRADTTLYRNYVYTEAPPLDCPIRAYGGLDDPNITRDHLAAWANETTRSFDLKMFPGGHFFIHSQQKEFLEALARDLPGT